MATVFEISAATLSKDLGQEVPEVFVVVAKHSVMGLDTQAIQELIGCSREDVEEVENDSLYKAVRAQVASVNAIASASQTSGWDAIEQTAIDNLMKRLPFEKDSEFLLKTAAVANRATRKHGGAAVLNPQAAIGRRTITLTQRLVSRLGRDGTQEQTETRELSIADGSMANPTFDQVNDLLHVRNTAVLPKAVEISTHNAQPSEDELFDAFMKS